jgi:invasion protein IalB
MWKLRIVAAIVMTIWLGAPAAFAEARVVSRHGNWELSCPVSDPTPSSSGCKLIIKLGEGPDLRSVAVDRREGGRLFVRLTFVVGIHLPRGVDIAFDGEKKLSVPFEKCLPQDGGCIVEFEATPFLDRLKAGGVMMLAFARTANSATRSEVTIDGFADGLAALDAVAPPGSTVLDASGTTVTSHGAWQMFCPQAANAAGARICNAVQFANATADRENLKGVLIARLDKPLFLQVSVSGTVVVGKGLGLAIDGQPQGTVQFDACGPLGCTVGARLADIVEERLRAAKTVTFTYTIQPDRIVTLPFSLDGLREASAGSAR